MIFFLIPAYNEEESIAYTLQGIHAEMKKICKKEKTEYEIVLCNNNSSDNTAEIAQHNNATVVTEKKRGYGYTLMKGISYIQTKYDDIPESEKKLIFMDADGQDCAENISVHIENLKTVDFSIASRVGEKTDATSMLHSLVNKIFGWGLYMRTGGKFTDLGPFRALSMKTFLALEMKEYTYGWTAEMQKKIVQQKYSYIEFFSSPQKRFSGESKVSGSHALKQMRIGLQILWVIVK